MTLRAWQEEPISKKHERKAFGCGDAELNDFLQRYARQSHDLGGAKTLLAIDSADNKTILDFYSLAPGVAAYADAPEVLRRGLAQHDVPGFRLARIATHVRVHGQGLGGQLYLVPLKQIDTFWERNPPLQRGGQGDKTEETSAGAAAGGGVRRGAERSAGRRRRDPARPAGTAECG